MSQYCTANNSNAKINLSLHAFLHAITISSTVTSELSCLAHGLPNGCERRAYCSIPTTEVSIIITVGVNGLTTTTIIAYGSLPYQLQAVLTSNSRR